MTPRTRSSNRDAKFKVYYSKKVPQQVHFPHRRKTVRRPDDVGKDGSEKRQMRFLPEKMKIQRVNTVQDSEEEDDDEDLAVEQKTAEDVGSRDESVNNRRKKRHSHVMEAAEDDDNKYQRPAQKRMRRSAPTSRCRSMHLKAESEDEADVAPTSAGEKLHRSRTLKRQSTMTQLVEGRRPLSRGEEPGFKPAKRSPRLSTSGNNRKVKDKQQRTLTQMVPGMKSTEPLSDPETEGDAADAEAQERESQAYGEAIAARFAQEGLIGIKSDGVEAPRGEVEASHEKVTQNNNMAVCASAVEQHSDMPSVGVASVENDLDDAGEESYRPTQFMDAPVTRTKRGSRQVSVKKQCLLRVAEAPVAVPQSSRKSRFSLLSTPEKRRIREIPSSQSPADSPLSTQISPLKKYRSPLQERSGNKSYVAETPSRRKEVKFQEPAMDPIPPPILRNLQSTIQDSEDEDEDLLESDENGGNVGIGAHTQALIHAIDNAAPGKDIGAETQAILDQIDQACGNPDNGDDGESSEELEESAYTRIQHKHSPGPQEQCQNRISNHNEGSQEARPPYRATHAGIKEKQWDDVEMLDLTTQQADAKASMEVPAITAHLPSSPPIMHHLIEETDPSAPMFIKDSSDEDDEIDITPPRMSTTRVVQPSCSNLQQSADLDEQLVQVPGSPKAQPDTSQSHSSKAEQQLHNEWFSYSQYVNARPPKSSSMNVAHDKFSYHATPMPPRPLAPPQNSGHYTSQATTVDEVTPRKTRTQHTYSANTTPPKLASLQPIVSPSKPPPLFIPSSFPSPAKARMEEWSSPVLDSIQTTHGAGGSLDDFSIPPLPPFDEDSLDD